MNQPDILKGKILHLEEKLLTPQTRSSPEELGRLLADDFIEFGSSGRVYNKQQIIDALAGESGSMITLADFQVRPLASKVVMATYRTTDRSSPNLPTRRALRLSIWRFESSRWQMVFHQGTPIE